MIEQRGASEPAHFGVAGRFHLEWLSRRARGTSTLVRLHSVSCLDRHYRPTGGTYAPGPTPQHHLSGRRQ